MKAFILFHFSFIGMMVLIEPPFHDETKVSTDDSKQVIIKSFIYHSSTKSTIKKHLTYCKDKHKDREKTNIIISIIV